MATDEEGFIERPRSQRAGSRNFNFGKYCREDIEEGIDIKKVGKERRIQKEHISIKYQPSLITLFNCHDDDHLCREREGVTGKFQHVRV